MLLEAQLTQMENAAEQIHLRQADLEQHRAVLRCGDEFFRGEDVNAETLRRESIILDPDSTIASTLGL